MNTRQRAVICLASPALLAALFTALPALAQYKVVGPDGKITYTDRPPVSTDSKVQPVSAGGTVSSDAGLPYELRQVAQRYPVTLYTSGDCAPCDAARQFLRGRGVPYAEKSVVTQDDTNALQRLTGANTLPVATVGSQLVRGWERGEWTSYLDAAGYPKESKLPTSYQQAQATPLTERKEVVTAPAPAPRRPAAAPAPAADAAPPSGIRF